MRTVIAGFSEKENKIKGELLNFLTRLNGAVEFVDIEVFKPRVVLANACVESISCAYFLKPTHDYRYQAFRQEDEVKRTDTGVLSWNEIFTKMEEIRDEYYLEDADYLIMLVDKPNEHNWFSAFDDSFNKNIFVHTGEWDLFVSSDKLYPIAYEVATAPFQARLLEKNSNLDKYVHHEPIGCMNDFCENKSEITYKLRTADICSPCLDSMISKGISSQEIFHLFQILDEIRVHSLFFSTHFKRGLVSKVVIDKHGKLHFIDFGKEVTVELPPQQLALYIFYLAVDESVEHLDLWRHKTLLERIYGTLSGGDKSAVVQTVEGLVTDAAKVRSVISKIKRQFIYHLGEKLARGYYITEQREGGHGIAADRELYDKSAFLANYPNILG